MKTYRKIDIFVDGEYVCSTNQRKTLKEAIAKFIEHPVYIGMDKETNRIGDIAITVRDKKVTTAFASK